MSLISLPLKTTSHGCPKDQRPIVEFNLKLYFDNFQHFVIPLSRYIVWINLLPVNKLIALLRKK